MIEEWCVYVAIIKNCEFATGLIYCRLLYRKRVKQGRAYLQSQRQQHILNENYYQLAPFSLGSGATAAAISKHQEAFQSAQGNGETAFNAYGDLKLNDGTELAQPTPPPYENPSGPKPENE